MDAFEAGAGISTANLSYIIAPLLVVMTVILVGAGFIQALKDSRYGDGAGKLLLNLVEGVGVVLLTIAMVYFLMSD